MTKFLFVPWIFLFTYFNSSAQSTRLHGTVIDSLSGATLEEASLSLEKLPDHTVVQRLRSGRDGFQLRVPAYGSYRLVTSYLGYLPDTTAFSFEAKAPRPAIRVRLLRSNNPLMQVVVRAAIPPAIVRNDTIAFNAGAYATRPNATVEDLLKRLPGIEIDKDGNITMQGHKVDKIYLDGKEFFIGDLKTATQNLPADLVAQVEAFDSQSDQAKLTGVRNKTGTKTLNIRLKKDKKKGVFGKIYAGAGPAGSYAAGATATSLASDRWLMGMGGTNNINNQFTGAEHANGPGSGGIQTSNQAGLNYRDKWGSKISATLNGGFDQSRTTLTTTSNRQTFLADSSLLENRTSRSESRSRNFRGDAAFEYRPDTNNTFFLHSEWAPQHSQSTTRDTVSIQTRKPSKTYLSSTGETDNTAQTDGNSLSNALDFRHRFTKKGRTFYLGLTETAKTQSSPTSLYNRINSFDSASHTLPQLLTDQRSSQQNSENAYGANLAYTEPISQRHLLDFNYRINTNASRSDKHSLDFDSATGRYDLIDTLTSNRFYNRSTVQRISAGYNATEGKLRYQVGVAAQITNLENDNYTAKNNLRQDFTNWFPRAGLLYEISSGHILDLDYRGSSSAPTTDQLQPIPDLSNPFLVKVGNPNLQPQFEHSLGLTYTSFTPLTGRNFQAGVDGSYTEHRIAASTTTLPGGIQQIQYVNTENNWHLSTNLAYGFPLGDKKGSGDLEVHGQIGQETGYTNALSNTTTSASIGGRCNLHYHLLEKLFIDAAASLDYTGAAYSLNTSQDSRTSQQTYSVDISYELPGALTLASNYNLQRTGSQAAPAQTTALWNAALYKSLFANHAGQLRLSAFDLLGTSTSLTQTAGTNYTETRQSNLPGRLLLLSFVYHFRQFAAGG